MNTLEEDKGLRNQKAEEEHTEGEKQAIYNEGYRDGLEDGRSEGYSEGKSDGEAEGYDRSTKKLGGKLKSHDTQ
jgi:flagellar biosynthesis/type III secretory pathway protein FliH